MIRELGVQMVETKLPDFPYGPVISTILGSEAATIFEPLITSGKVDELADQKQIAGLKAGLEIPAKDYLKAMRIRRLIKQEFAKMFAEWTCCWRPAVRARRRRSREPLDRPSHADARTESAGHDGADPGGQPGRSAGDRRCRAASRTRLPVAIQLVGPPFSENMLLAIGKEFQERTDWHKRRPPV